jgi:PPOX class probable FMN-dependent enzyme
VLSSVAPDGRVDVSPKGGTPGFVAVLDDHRLAIPDMSGNNRLDSLRNIVGDAGAGKVAVLALVPAVGETLRVNGTARVTTDPAVLDACPVDGKRPRVAVVVEVDTAFLHCAKALRRSGIWEPERWPSTDDMASTACMLHDHIGLTTPVEATEERLAQSYAATTWEMGGVDPS